MTTPSLAEFQAGFCANLLQPTIDQAFVEQVRQKPPADARTRLTIYRNNVLHSLATALGDLYPVVRRLIGEDCFKTVAVHFIRQSPPENPSLIYYGEQFPGFLGQWQPLRQLPYLTDVARLEWLCHQAFHSADTALLDINQLATIDPERLDQLTLTTHPSVGLLQSPWPVDDIWTENQKADPEELNLDQARSACVLVFRESLDVRVVALEPACFVLLKALSQGRTISDAADGVQACTPMDEAAFSSRLAYLLGLPLFTGFHIP